MSECNHDCSNCKESESCETKPIEKLKMKEGSSAKKIIGVVSGKGGVGKSFTTSYLAVILNRLGYRVGIIDADVTGPSIPFAFGVTEKALGSEEGIFPATTKTGIKIISSNMFLDDDSSPIVWRGSLISSLVEQFFTDVLFEELDFLLIDMPPGTGDVALTTFQKIPLDSLVLVSSPQSLVRMVVTKALNMAKMMDISIEALITNMAYIECPDCGKKIPIYGPDNSKSLAAENGIPLHESVPFDSRIIEAIEDGRVEELQVDYLKDVAIELASTVK